MSAPKSVKDALAQYDKAISMSNEAFLLEASHRGLWLIRAIACGSAHPDDAYDAAMRAARAAFRAVPGLREDSK